MPFLRDLIDDLRARFGRRVALSDGRGGQGLAAVYAKAIEEPGVDPHNASRIHPSAR